MASASRPVQEPPSRCFGIDAEDGCSAVLVERCGLESRAPEWYSLDERGLDALAERVTGWGERTKVCVSSRGARALDVAGRMIRAPRVELLFLFERGGPACIGTAAQAAHAYELARSAQRAA